MQATRVLIEICRDRDCGQIEEALVADGTTARPAISLTPGVHFWRVSTSTAGETHTSFTWEFRTLARNAPIDNAFGSFHDFNGDGYADLIVGEQGQVRVYSGSSRGFGPIDGTLVPNPNPASPFFGEDFTSSDLDGDGYSDLIVGATGVVDGLPVDEQHAGAAYVFRGGPDGLALRPSATIRGRPQVALFGRVVGAQADVDGDGYGDFGVADAGVFGASGPGIVRVYFGDPGYVSLRLPVRLTLSASDHAFAAFFPTSMSSPGDFDGDGSTDLLVAVLGPHPFGIFPGAVPLGSLSGRLGVNPPSFASRGSVLPLNRCDTDGDGKSEVVMADGDGSPKIALLRLAENSTWQASVHEVGLDSDPLSGISVRCSPDFDGDGVGDLILAVQTQTGLQTHQTTRTIVVRGAVGSIEFDAPTLLDVDQSSRNTRGFSADGDMNRDGVSDAVVVSSGVDPRHFAIRMYLGGASVGARTVPDQELPWDSVNLHRPTIQF